MADTGLDFGGNANFDEDGNLVVSVAGDSRAPWQQVADGKPWSSVDADSWNFVKDTIKGKYDFPNTTVFQSRVNKFVADFTNKNGRLPTETEISNSSLLNTYMTVLRSGTPTILPPAFYLEGTYYNNDPYLGPQAPRLDDSLSRFLRNDAFRTRPSQTPKFTNESIAALFQGAPQPPPGGRGRGGGRAPRVFDRDQLIEGATDRWKGLLLENPDESKIGSLVDSYSAKGNAFWMKQGGNLDFDTYVVNEIRKQSRYKTLYSQKDPYLSEEEWMGRYRGAVGQFGLNAQATLRETEAGLTSGAGVAGFTERVGRTREARLAQSGGFSRQLANQMSQMGRLG